MRVRTTKTLHPEGYQFCVIKTRDGTGEYKSEKHDIECWLVLPPATRMRPRMKTYDDFDGTIYHNREEFIVGRIKELGVELRKLDYKAVWQHGNMNLVRKALLAGNMLLVKKTLKTASIFVFVEEKYQKTYLGDD